MTTIWLARQVFLRYPDRVGLIRIFCAGTAFGWGRGPNDVQDKPELTRFYGMRRRAEGREVAP